VSAGAALAKAALYLRVSTGRQAESDLSIPDQRRQITAYCVAKGWDVAAEFVEPGNTATDDRRPAFQAMIDAALVTPPTFTVIVVHSFSRFFRDQFQFGFYVRKLAKNGVRLISITQDLGDDPMSVMMRQIMTLFDEYQSKENAKHTLRAMKENARQGYWNGALPPIGYRIVAAEQRGAKIKKKLEIDPIHADTVRLFYRLALNGDGNGGPMGIKSITTYLNDRDIRTRDGGRWGIASVHQILTHTTYIGHARPQDAHGKTRGRACGHGRSADHHRRGVRGRPGGVEGAQPAMDAAARGERSDFAHRDLLLCILWRCDDATDRQGQRRRHRYYTCSTKARQGAVVAV
jgi:site-specific DNA recombinase